MTRASAIAFGLAFLLVGSVTYAFSVPVAPARNAATPTNAAVDQIFVFDPNISGLSDGITNVTPKPVICANTEALGYDTSTKAFVCLSVGGGGSCPAPCPTELQSLAVDAGIVRAIDLQLTSGFITTGDPSQSTLHLGTAGGDHLMNLATSGSSVVEVLASGVIRSNTPFYWAMDVGGITLVAGNTYGGIITTGATDTAILAASGIIGSAGAGGTTHSIVTITDGIDACDCDIGPCNGTGPEGGEGGCSGTCVFTLDTPLAFTVSSIGDCVSGPQFVGSIQIEGSFEPSNAPP